MQIQRVALHVMDYFHDLMSVLPPFSRKIEEHHILRNQPGNITNVQLNVKPMMTWSKTTQLVCLPKDCGDLNGKCYS